MVHIKSVPGQENIAVPRQSVPEFPEFPLSYTPVPHRFGHLPGLRSRLFC